MNNFTRLQLTLTLICFAFLFNAQVNIRDRWDTLYSNVDYANTTTCFQQKRNTTFGNMIAMISDSVDATANASHFKLFNTSSNLLTTINYTRLPIDRGAEGCAVITNTSSGTSYVFFGAKNDNTFTDNVGLYKYNSSTNAITSETISVPNNYHYGVYGIGFYSPNTSNDSLTLFVNETLSSSDSIYIYRKQYAQVGFVNTQAKLPVRLDVITKVMEFNNELYVAGFVYPDDGVLLKSSDGINFTVISNFSTVYPFKYIADMDTLNGKLYLGISASTPGYEIAETSDGSNYTYITTNTSSPPVILTSLKNFNKTIWISSYVNASQKAINPSNSSVNNTSDEAPNVWYLDLATNSEVLSIDTLGRAFNHGLNFRLQSLNSKLYLAGHHYDVNFSNIPGTFVYQFIPPVANFSVSSNNLCLNSPYTFVSQSLNTDSVRWFVDNNFYSSTNNNFAYSFTSTGTHTLGIIAISGTQKDTLQYNSINVYSVGVTLSPSTVGCLNNKTTITPTVSGAINPISYTWSCSSALTQTSLSSPVLKVTATASGSYTFDLNVSDANGCPAYSGISSLSVNPNKDITGTADVASVPLTNGNVILYKYEPILTKFDSITFQALDASGNFTFVLQDAYTYILKCEPTTNTLLITYAPSEASWKTATVVSHGCVNGTNQNISVIPLLNIGTGPGALIGKITEGQNYGGRGTIVPGNPIGGLTIKGGKNPGGGIVAQGKTNPAGEYTLSSLPLSAAGESYFVLVDVPGLDTNTTYHKAITSASLQITGLDFVIDSAKINPTLIYAGLNQINFDNDVVRLFPNPTSGLLNIGFTLDQPETVEVILSDITGKKIRTIVSSQYHFNKEIKLQTNLNDLKNGVYLIKLIIGDAERTSKIIITN